MSVKFILLALPIIAVSQVSATETRPLEKNGLPCVDEICLGDSIPELSKIKWVPAENPVKVNNRTVLTAERQLNHGDLLALKGTFPDPTQAGPYFHNRQFDQGALPGLARTVAACEANELFGTFVSPDGSKTKVGVSLLPVAPDAARQAWKVTTISREYAGVSSNQERSLANDELKKRYYKFGASNPYVGNPKAGDGRFFANGMNRAGFALAVVRGGDEDQRMKMHPACGAK
ncbi:MAG: hypothetical protein V4723_15420 [Pseudomonadota bacterium]